MKDYPFQPPVTALTCHYCCLYNFFYPPIQLLIFSRAPNDPIYVSYLYTNFEILHFSYEKVKPPMFPTFFTENLCPQSYFDLKVNLLGYEFKLHLFVVGEVRT